MENQINPEKIVESLMQTIAQQAQQVAMLQAIVAQAVVNDDDEPASDEPIAE